MIWSLYLSISGQAILSAYGLFTLAQTDYIKDNNFLLPKGDGTFIKIPKPRELGVMFGSSVERTMRAWQDEDPEAFTRFGETVKTNFMFPTRSIIAPLNDVRANKNFIGAPVVSGAVSRLSPQFQYDEKTSEPAKFLGGVLKQSPQQIDYLAKSYLGVIGQLGIPATTKNASVLGTLKKQVTADPGFQMTLWVIFIIQWTRFQQVVVMPKQQEIVQWLRENRIKNYSVLLALSCLR